MTKLEQLIKELCPNGVEFVPLWSVTIWDKKFNSVDRKKQPKSINYPYLLAKDLFALEVENGDVFLLSTGEQTGWTNEELAGDNLCEGEVVTIPWGKSRAVVDCIKYYKGKFVTADNRIMTSNDTNRLLNKYLYYWILTKGKTIDTFYRGSGIKHPDMAKVLDLQIPVPPMEVQSEIVKILDEYTESVTALQQELEKELTARKKQYEYYRDLLLDFGVHGGATSECEWRTLGVVTSVLRGKRLTKNQLSEEYKYPVYHGGLEPLGYYNDTNREKNTVMIINVGASAGTVGYSNIEFWSSDGCYCLKHCDEYDARFLYYYLQSQEKYLQSKVRYAGIPTLDAKVIDNISVPVISIKEQERIVNILDRFDKLCNDITEGLPAEIEARRKQYEYYRDKLLSFEEVRA